MNATKANILLILLLSACSIAARAESATEIQAGAKAFIESQLEQLPDYKRTSIEVGQLDSRLNLPSCTMALNYRLHGKALQPGKLLVKVNCPGQNAWSVYVPAQLRAFKKVAVLKQATTRNTRIKREQVYFEERDLSTISNFYIDDPRQLEDMVVSRNLAAGSVLSARNLQPAKVVKRGQEVTILAQAGPVQVSMVGIAKSDGRKGQQIRVKNQRSGRIIRATVVDDQLVQVVL